MPAPDFLNEIESFSEIHHAGKPVFPEIDTKSNLWPQVLQELLDAADLTLQSLSSHRTLIKTLVSRRNSIAHGNHDLIQEVAYYRNYEAAVYDIMYELAFSVDERLMRAPYV